MSLFQELLAEEELRLKTGVNLIASENYPSKDVRKIVGSIFSAKYAEGAPLKRFYSGCRVVDKMELAVQNLVKNIFKAEHANVQPHSGSQANEAVFLALLRPGDLIMAMSFDAGGHLTHGNKLNFSGKNYDFVFYSVDENSEKINYDEVERLATEKKPKLIIAGASSYPFLIDFERFAKIAHKVGAIFMADIAHVAGLIPAGVLNSPAPYADIVTFTTHKTLRGPRGGVILCKEKFAKQIDRAVMPGLQGGPFMNNIAAKGVCFQEAKTREFAAYQLRVTLFTKLFTEVMMQKGFEFVAGGTDSHLAVLKVSSIQKLREEDQTGDFVAKLLEQVNIFVNKNVVPRETKPPMLTSGIRIGFAPMANFLDKQEQVLEIASFFERLFNDPYGEDNKQSIVADVKNFMSSLDLNWL